VIFAGGSALETYGAGDGLSSALFAAVARAGVTVHYDTRALSLCRTNGVVEGVRVFARGVDGGKEFVISAKSVVVAAGGFEANPEWRARYLGPGWELAKVRGSRFNTGDGLRMVLDAGGKPYGNWSGCHSASWDLNAPDANTLEFGTVFKRDDFANGIAVQSDGKLVVAGWFSNGSNADFAMVRYHANGSLVCNHGTNCFGRCIARHSHHINTNATNGSHAFQLFVGKAAVCYGINHTCIFTYRDKSTRQATNTATCHYATLFDCIVK
jgi:tricarballylate dehydrogenase